MATQIQEDFSPIYINDTGSELAPQFQYANGQYVDLSNAAIVMKMLNIDTGQLNVCAGAWIIDDALTGRAHYQYQAADVAVAGIWKLFITITIGGKPQHADERLLEIKYAP